MPGQSHNNNSLQNASIQETALDGAYYAILTHLGGKWRLGSISPRWHEEIAALGAHPSQAELNALASRGTWLLPMRPSPPMAVMCCGLGSTWSGMGRELYDNFPAAATAMDQLASYADWDVLALLNEPEFEKINHTRWQIPYLFLLEYAQWRQFLSLGLKPALMSGHSLGELVALCLAGSYSPESAWYLLETRSEHMAELAAKTPGQSGMLAVSADFSVISQILATWPALRISNRNTPGQHILGGPLDALAEARKTLRRNHVPAMLLNIDLAFHNPAMRILRDLSLRRLNALEIRKPQIPMLSCVRADLYPDSKHEICEYIADLDENTVDWTESVHGMLHKFNIGCFLEIGPQETLCGLVTEIEPMAECLACDAKKHETAAMRQTCARLFALGHLSLDAILAEKSRRPSSAPALNSQAIAKNASDSEIESRAGIDPVDYGIIIDLLAEICQKPKSGLRPDMDLRYDLALRSSRFPFVVQEAERRLNRPVALENLLQISTVGDLARLLSGTGVSGEMNKTSGGKELKREGFPLRGQDRNPLSRFKADWSKPGAELKPAPLTLGRDARITALDADSLIALCVFDHALLPWLWKGLAPFGCRLAIPADLLPACEPLTKAGCQLIELACGHNADALKTALDRLAATYGKISGILYAGPAISGIERAGHSVFFAGGQLEHDMASRLDILGTSQSWFCALQRFVKNTATPVNQTNFLEAARQFQAAANSRPLPANARIHVISWLDERKNPHTQNPDEPGDMMAMEILYGTEPHIIWKQWKNDSGQPFTGPYRASSDCFRTVFPDPEPQGQPQAGLFQGAWQISRFADPSLSQHGITPAFSPLRQTVPSSLFPESPWLPPGHAMMAMLECARLQIPWLHAIGFSDLRFFRLPALPFGITRECRLAARAKPWLMHENVMTRILRVSMSVRELSANGRRLQTYLPASDGVCIFAAKAAGFHDIWKGKQALSASMERRHADGLLDVFYQALGFGGQWRFLRNFGQAAVNGNASGAAPGPAYQADLALPKSSFACNGDWGYTKFLHMTEGIFHGAMLVLALDGMERSRVPDIVQISASLAKWHCGAIGFIRFNPSHAPLHEDATLRLQLGRSWHDERLARFDAQIRAENGETVLTMHHMEFDRIN